MNKDKKEEKKIYSNKLIDEIIKTFPKSISVYPRGAFESQLRAHLSKHGVGKK